MTIAFGIGGIGNIASKGGKVFKRSSTQGKAIRAGGGGFSALAAIPRSLALAGVGSVIGGGLHVVGGMMSLAAAGIGVANTVTKAGLMATSGAMGGLGGGGKSGNVKKEQNRRNIWRFSAKGIVDGKLVAEATYTAMIAN